MSSPVLYNSTSPKNLLTGHAGLGQIQSSWYELGLARIIDECTGKARGYLPSLLLLVAVAKHAIGYKSNAAISKESREDPLLLKITGFVVKQFTLSRVYERLGEEEIKRINRTRVKSLVKRGRIRGNFIAIDSTHEEIKRTKGFEGWSVGHTGEGDEKPGYRSVFTFDVISHEWITFSQRTASFYEGYDLLPLVLETKELLGKSFMLLMDAGFHSVERFAELLAQDVQFIIRAREDIKVREPHKEFTTVQQEIDSTPPQKVFKYDDLGVVYSWSKTVYLDNCAHKFRLVVAYKKTERGIEKCALLCSDLAIEPRMVIELYEKRWGVETFFDYLKNDLFLEKFCKHDFAGIRAHVFVCALAYGLLILARGPESNAKPATVINCIVNRPANFEIFTGRLVLYYTNAIVQFDWGR